jgi:hypothetical protein
LILYSEVPARSVERAMVTSLRSSGSTRDELSRVSSTSAMPSFVRPADPAKITSSIDPPRRLEGAWAPRTHERASAMLDLPDPLGPTITLTPGRNSSTVGSANDLKPDRRNRLTNMPMNLCARDRYQAALEGRNALSGS